MATQNASSTSGSVIITEVPTGNNTGNNGENTVRIKLKNPNKIKNVKWTEGTVDNEFLNKKSSKSEEIHKFISNFEIKYLTQSIL